MLARYRDYRSYGHGPIIAAVHSVQPERLFIAAAFVGAVVGIFL
ncbi:hypothetical protein PMI42_01694 [Bradyrhizobium sp. YR681]|nr:hypothetical protein PMI42_01694 [Bradyrhizobium sp. YR681]